MTLRAADPLICAAAADLSPLGASLSAKFPGLQFTFGSSGALARQIRNGAPYDVYLSASEQYVRELADAGAVWPDSVRVYAEGRLAIWSRSGKVKSLEDLAKSGTNSRIAIANPAFAPYGAAAREVLQRRGLWKAVESRVIFAENIRQTLQFAESGNVDACLVAHSLVAGREGAVLIPAEWHSPIRQAGAIVKDSPHESRARQLLEFLGSPEGRKLLESKGFSVPK